MKDSQFFINKGLNLNFISYFLVYQEGDKMIMIITTFNFTAL
jgi:hypothetical protein